LLKDSYQEETCSCGWQGCWRNNIGKMLAQHLCTEIQLDKQPLQTDNGFEITFVKVIFYLTIQVCHKAC
ncbi:MAG: hypothetical protein M3297_16830, partial [Thermoproteota archaeon]|nr:hypothetical protein [Thermoproteota archaeon]